MKEPTEKSLGRSRHGERIAIGAASLAFVLAGCENTVPGIPIPVSVIEEASQTGSAIPLPEGMECPTGGQPVNTMGGDAIAQSFIAVRYRDHGQKQKHLAANYPVERYVAQNGMEVYCGDTNAQYGISHQGNMIVPNSCVNAGGDTGEVGAIVQGINPAPSEPWWDDISGAFIGCPI